MRRPPDGRSGTAAAAWTAALAVAAVLTSAGGVPGGEARADAAGSDASVSAGPMEPGAHPLETASAAAARDSAVRVRRRVRAMGTLLTGTAWAGRRATAVEGLEAAVRAVEAMEDRLSTWRDDTPLAVLNAAPPGRPTAVGDTLMHVLREVRRWRRATGGAFDPGVGRLIEAWDLRGEGRVPTADELDAALGASGLDCWEVDAGAGTVTPRCEGAWIDAGAFGKGAGLRDARAALREADVGAALLDFGGQLLAVGRPPGESGWRAGVAHPSERDRTVAALEVTDASVATSSASERFVVVDGEVRGHVLDPRTGEPVPRWGSVTVVADDPLAADALSTGLFVMGPGTAAAWAEERQDVGVLVLAEDDAGRLDAAWNEPMERHLAARPEAGALDGRSAPGPEPGDLDDGGDGHGAAPRTSANR